MAELSSMVQKDWSTMRDPRRTIVMFHSWSNNPRSKKWYRVAEACEFEGKLYLHRDHIKDDVQHMHQTNGASPRSFSDAVKLAKAHAKESGNPYVPGRHQGYFGQPLTRI